MKYIKLSITSITAIAAVTWLATAANENHGPRPVEESMHEFMEYAFEPNYKRLRVIMKTEPADKKGWKPIKGDALALAEACNLLFDRLPDDNTELWKKLAAETRDEGADFYGAAKERNWDKAVKTYQAMLTSCNQCHKDFADGDFQMKPFLD